MFLFDHLKAKLDNGEFNICSSDYSYMEFSWRVIRTDEDLIYKLKKLEIKGSRTEIEFIWKNKY